MLDTAERNLFYQPKNCYTTRTCLRILQCYIYINIYIYICIYILLWCCDLTRVMASSFLRFLDHTQRRTTVDRTPLDEWSVRRRDLYLTTHNNHNRQISMLLVEFEPTISAGERPQTYALDHAATGTGSVLYLCIFYNSNLHYLKMQVTNTYLLHGAESFLRS